MELTLPKLEPQVYDVDIMACKDLEELKKIVSVFKIQMTLSLCCFTTTETLEEK